MIHGIVQDGTIVPLDPISPEWGDGRHVVIDDAREGPVEQRSQIESWYANLEALGPAQYEPGERAAIEKIMADADREAKEYVRRTWAPINGVLFAGHQPPERGAER